MSKSVAGLLSGLAVIVLTLIVVGIVNLHESGNAVSAELLGAKGCREVRVAQDQGYEITREVARDICDSIE